MFKLSSYEQQNKFMNEIDKYLKLLELTIQEEHYFLQEHQHRIKFYTGLITGLIAVTFGGFINIKHDFHYYALLVGPILIIVISSFAIQGTFRMYQRYLEAITQRAKIEQKLGLTSENEILEENGYWQEEAIISQRHILNRKKFKSSELFVNHFSKLGYHKNTVNLFKVFLLIGIFSAVGLIIISLIN